jgi:cephalosporin hydroxylase
MDSVRSVIKQWIRCAVGRSHGTARHGLTLRDIYNTIDPGTIDRWDAYIDIYDRLFVQFRRQPVQVLEIGVLRGGSLAMWSRYFHADSIIVGLDRDSRCKTPNIVNVRLEFGDQADKGILERIKKKYKYFDIVIDDGGHFWRQQSASFENLYECTRSLYIVEDTHTSYWNKYGEPHTQTFVDLAKQKVDLLHDYFIAAGSPDKFGFDCATISQQVSEFRKNTQSIEFFDSMIVFKKGHNPTPFRARKLSI